MRDLIELGGCYAGTEIGDVADHALAILELVNRRFPGGPKTCSFIFNDTKVPVYWSDKREQVLLRYWKLHGEEKDVHSV